MKRETLNKEYLLKITKLAAVKLEDISELEADIDTSFLCKLIESAQKRLSDTSKVELNVDEYQHILKYICYTKAILPEGTNSYKDAIDQVYQKYHTQIVTKMCEKARTRAKKISEIICVPSESEASTVQTEEVSSLPVVNIPQHNNTFKPKFKCDEEAFEYTVEFLKNANLLEYVSQVAFSSFWMYTEYTVYDMVTSAFLDNLSILNRYFNHISTFPTSIDTLFVADIEEYMYDIALEKVDVDDVRNMVYQSALYEYLPYFSQYVEHPKYFTNDDIHKLLNDIIARRLMNYDVRALYYLNTLAIKSNFPDTEVFHHKLALLCHSTFYISYTDMKDFIKNTKMRCNIVSSTEFIMYFNTKDKIENIFNFTNRKKFINYYNSGFEIRDIHNKDNAIDKIILAMISLRIDIHNEIVSADKKTRKRLKCLKGFAPIFNAPYPIIISKVGKENVSKKLDILIRKYCACRNYYNACAIDSQFPQIVLNLRALYKIADYEVHGKPVTL